MFMKCGRRGGGEAGRRGGVEKGSGREKGKKEEGLDRG